MQVFVALLLILSSPAFAKDICATSFTELDRSENLKTLKPLFSADRQIAMVNETKGSYVVISAFDDKLGITFYTSGIFDLYPIRKEGPLSFCDDGATLRMLGLDRSDKFTVVEGGFHMGDGGPKRNFASGPMPDLLKKLHKIDIRGIASETK